MTVYWHWLAPEAMNPHQEKCKPCAESPKCAKYRKQPQQKAASRDDAPMRSLQARDDTSPARKEKEEGEGDERGPSESAPRAVSGAEETIAANRKGQQSEASRSAAATADSPPLSAADDPGRNQSALPTREEERSETSSDGEEGDFIEQCRRNKKKKSVGTTPLLPSPTSGKRNSVNSLHAHARRSETSTTILFSPCRHGKSFRGVSGSMSAKS